MKSRDAEALAQVMRGFSPAPTPKRRQRKGREEWDVISLDVWGNAQDGFEINDMRRAGTVMLPKDATKAQIVRAMKRENWLKSSVRSARIEVDDFGDDEYGQIALEDSKTGEPIYHLKRDTKVRGSR